jgi:hypothetical protein
MDAGHMVPMDVPEIALKMINTFIQKGSFRTGDSKVGVSPTEPTAEALAALPARKLAVDSPAGGGGGGSHAHHSVYAPTIALASPLESGVYLRLRLQHPGRSSGGGGGGGGGHAGGGGSGATVQSHSGYMIRIDPGAKIFKIEGKWFDRSSLQANLVIEGLIPGIEYSFVIQHNTSLHLSSFSTRRVVVTKPGCYNNKFAQCCEHGDCTVSDESKGSTYCLCDPGYYGGDCDLYNIAQSSSALYSDTDLGKHSISDVFAQRRRQKKFVESSKSSMITSKNANFTTQVVCSMKVLPPEDSLKLDFASFQLADASKDGGSGLLVLNPAKPCSTTNTTMKCCISIELLVKLAEDMVDTPVRYLESFISTEIKNAINFLVGFKNLIAIDVTIGSEPSLVKLLKSHHSKKKNAAAESIDTPGHLGGSSTTATGTTTKDGAAASAMNRQMTLILSMCGSPNLLNKIYNDFELQVKDPTSYINQDIQWRLSPHYYRLVSQRSFSLNDMASYKTTMTTKNFNPSLNSSSSSGK